jgi:DNA-binding Lrp family transcriptional regulator
MPPEDTQLPGTRAAEWNADDAAIARLVMRFSGEYVLRAFQLLVDTFGDVRAGLLVQAINVANIAAVYRSDEGRRAAGADGSLPDELRRPISIARLADSTGLPFETTRRVVQRLIDTGACRRAKGGVIVPRSTVQRPEIVRNAIINLGYVSKFARDLHAAGMVGPIAFDAFPSRPGDDVATARAVMGLSAEYILRALRLLADNYGGVQAGIVAQTIITANSTHLNTRSSEGWPYAGVDQAAPDEVRRPISIARLAESLGLPYETMRQQVARLIEASVCTRVEGGLIVPRAVLERPGAVRAALANVANVRKFLHDLQAAGIDASDPSRDS